MNIVMRKAKVGDIAGLDKVMQVISDGPGDREKMALLIENMLRDENKYLLVAVNEDNGEIAGLSLIHI